VAVAPANGYTSGLLGGPVRRSPVSICARGAALRLVACAAVAACAGAGTDPSDLDPNAPTEAADPPAEGPPNAADTPDEAADAPPAPADSPDAPPGDDTPTPPSDTAASPEPPADSAAPADPGPLAGDPFADAIVSFTPGPGAGFGQASLPGVVLGPPLGAGPYAGSLDVLSLGDRGEIVLALVDQVAVDGDGPDLIVFENPFPGWIEPGEVAVSEDGVTWAVFPCAPHAPGAPGCAGVQPVLSHPANGVSPTDPAVAGGDAFDLAAVGLARAAFVRVRDTGAISAIGVSAGFDLDAVAIVHAAPP
jgi:hypothetical protein